MVVDLTKRWEPRKKPLEAVVKVGLCGVGEHLVDFQAPGISVSTTTRLFLSDREMDALDAAQKDIAFAGIRLQKTLQTEQPIIQEFGNLFFKRIFKNGVDAALKQCLGQASRENRQLRIRLVLLDAAFSGLPLEFLFDVEKQSYLALNPMVSLVRAPDQIHPFQPVKIKSPLNMLAMLSTPLDQKPFDAQQEKALFEKALAPLQAQGLISVTWAENWTTLKENIQSGTPWHIFHVIGRCAFDLKAEECFLGMVDAAEKTLSISGEQLASLLRMQPSLRLAFLNVFEGGKAGTRTLFSSATAQLWLQSIQAVVILQTDASREAARTLIETFYTQLAGGAPVDEALTMARLEISYQAAHTLEWGTLVLSLSSVDAVLFDVLEDQPASSQPDNGARQFLDEGNDYYAKKEYPMALDAYTQALKAEPGCAEAQTSREALQLEMARRDELARCDVLLAEHSDLSIQLRRLDLLMELREYEQAAKDSDRLLSELGMAASPLVKHKLYTLKGDAYTALGESNLAESAYERARTYKPESLS